MQWSIAAFTVCLVFAPIAVALLQSVRSTALYEPHWSLTYQNYVRLLTNERLWEALGNSLALAVIGTATATIIGAALALILVRTNIALRRLFSELLQAPLYISSLVMAFGWYMLYGPSGYVTLAITNLTGTTPWNLYSLPAMGVLAGFTLVPVVFLYCSSTLHMMDASLEDAARSAGASPLRAMRSVTLPLMRPAILYALLLCFVGSIELLSIPLIFGRSARIEVFTTFLFSEGIGKTEPDYGLLASASVLLLVLMTLLVSFHSRLVGNARRFTTVKGKATRPHTIDLGRWRWGAFALVASYVTIVIVLPIAGLIFRAFVKFLTPLVPPWDLLTLDHFRALIQQPAYTRAIVNSFIVALFGAALVTALVTMLVLIVKRSEFKWGKTLETISLYPRAVPGIVVGIGFLWIGLTVPGFTLIHGTLFALVLAFSMRDLPTAFGAIAPAMTQISRELDQSARTCGADWFTASVRVIAPIARPAMLASYMLVFVSMLKEYAAAVFLFGPGSEIMGTVMLQLWTNGDFGPVAALAVVQVTATAAIVLAARRLMGVRMYE
ncbi:ABC transporter permease [Steroidobacter sp.]|uniref:ABC transporter permease n=1 Tax=Steroidobacter sp. TaxID=1978227 RepID=UPI001A4DD497|nr:iron ABC transporter permease [Steroidobacter sp.]MBL8271397.1 iron ABC transporter permease [Steroidobacter sp.]